MSITHTNYKFSGKQDTFNKYILKRYTEIAENQIKNTKMIGGEKVT